MMFHRFSVNSLFICEDLRPVYFGWPIYAHALQHIPAVGENQNHMRHNKENEEPHESRLEELPEPSDDHRRHQSNEKRQSSDNPVTIALRVLIKTEWS
jgi:hypothetical protein